jgi:hypothetical protein
MQITTVEVADEPQSPPATTEFDIPDPKWGQEKLAIYVKERLGDGKRLEEESIRLGRRSAEEVYYAGMALAIVKDQLKSKGKWMYWQELHGFAIQTVSETIKLYERIMDPEKIREMTITEAKIEAGIIKRRKPREKATATETPVLSGDGDETAVATDTEKPVTAEPVPHTSPIRESEGKLAAVKPSAIIETLGAEMEHLEAFAALLVTALGDDADSNIDPDVIVDLLDSVLERMRGVIGQLQGAKKTCQAKLPNKKPKARRKDAE